MAESRLECLTLENAARQIDSDASEAISHAWESPAATRLGVGRLCCACLHCLPAPGSRDLQAQGKLRFSARQQLRTIGNTAASNATRLRPIAAGAPQSAAIEQARITREQQQRQCAASSPRSSSPREAAHKSIMTARHSARWRRGAGHSPLILLCGGGSRRWRIGGFEVLGVEAIARERDTRVRWHPGGRSPTRTPGAVVAPCCRGQSMASRQSLRNAIDAKTA